MTDHVLFSVMPGNDGDLGIITLNRQQALNAINLAMVEAMLKQLRAWQVNHSIKAVVITASPGRAFCAGGDLRHTYDKNHLRISEMSDFFRTEYQLNKTIYHFPKPYIALWDGITMGGGVGISIHGSHRVATENLLFAMPETGIGFFPDVGGTYFLPRLPNKMGYYIGLTGARLKLADCIALGIATDHVTSDKLPELIKTLAVTKFRSDAVVSEIIHKFSKNVDTSPLMQHQALIEKAFTAVSMETLMEQLKSDPGEFCARAYDELLKKSPISLKVTLHALHVASELNFDNSMQQEFRLACRFLEGHDFSEGIRAVIIDKDQNPKWLPADLKEVSDEEVNSYFTPLIKELAY